MLGGVRDVAFSISHEQTQRKQVSAVFQLCSFSVFLKDRLFSFDDDLGIIFHISKHFLWALVWRGDSNEYPQHMYVFVWRTEENDP